MEQNIADIELLVESLCFYARVNLILVGCLVGFFTAFMVVYFIKIRGLL